MFSQFNYNAIIKNTVSAFGSMFSNIYVQRYDAKGNPIQQVKVPVLYSPKEQYLARLADDADFQRQIDQILPRIAFEIKSFSYDSDRKQNTLGRKLVGTANSNISKLMYNPVPYNLVFSMSILGKNAEDAAQILEQILPYFTPDWTLSMNLVPSMNEHKDIPFILQSVAWSDTYDGDFKEKRAIVIDMSFLCKTYFYGPVKKSNVILYANTNFFAMEDNTSSLALSTLITPGLTATGEPTSNSALSIPVPTIPANSNYGIVVSNTSPTPS